MSLRTFFDNFDLLADAPNGVAKLRELILQLAIEGKLVSQDPRDEPCSKLLERIKENKAELAKEQKLSNEEIVELIQEERTPFVLPNNWDWVRLSQITNAVHYGYTASANHALTDVRLLRITDIQNGKVDWSSVPGCEIDEEKLKGVKLANNDILIARTGGTIGKSYMVENLELVAVFASYLIRAIPNKQLFAKYLKLFFESELYWKQLYEKSMGTGQPNVNATSLKSLLLPLPGFEEQKRIVAKVGELMRLCDELEARQQQRRESRLRLNNATLAPLNNAASLAPEEFERASVRLADNFDALYDSAETIRRLRSTILQLAVQGKLVPQDSNDETASLLLERIKVEKERFVKTRKIKSNVSSVPITEEEVPFCVSNSWRWCRLEDICTLITDGKHGDCMNEEGSGYYFLSAKDVADGKLHYGKARQITKDDFLEVHRRTNLEPGDILITNAGSIGKTAIATDDERTFRTTFQKSVAVVKPHKEFIDSNYLALFCVSSLRRLESVSRGGAQKNLLLGHMKRLLTPVPPLQEQKRIVAKVNQLMTFCDELETKVRQAEADSEKVMKAAVQHVLASISERSTNILAGASA